MKDVCEAKENKGNGELHSFTLQGLRATMVSLLLDAGLADSDIAIRTGHRDVNSLKCHQGLCGGEGMKQMVGLFGSGFPAK